MKHLYFGYQPLIMVADSTLIPLQIINYKIIYTLLVSISNQIYNWCYPTIINLSYFANFMSNFIISNSITSTIYVKNFVKTVSNILTGYNVVFSSESQGFTIMNILFALMVVSFIVLSVSEIVYIICECLYSSTRDFVIEKMVSEIKMIKKQQYTRSEDFDMFERSYMRWIWHWRRQTCVFGH